MNGIIVEGVQQLLLRVAVALYLEDLAGVCDLYEQLSLGRVVFPHQTLIGAGRKAASLTTHFVLDLDMRFPETVMDTLRICSTLRLTDADVGIGLHSVPAKM